MDATTTACAFLALACVGAAATVGDAAHAAPAAAARVLVDGRSVTRARPVSPGARVVLTNGLVRVSVPGYAGQRAGVRLETRVGGVWREATSARYGDWTYPGASVVQGPTAVSVVSVSPRMVVVRWLFGRHVIPPGLGGGLVWPYPFEKRIWLRAGDRGAYTAIRPERLLPGGLFESEHEIGFGGVFGAANVLVGAAELQTDQLSGNARVDPAGGVAVASLRRDGSGLVRTLVPFPAAPVLVPVFDPESYGGLYVHHLSSRRYGAYLHAAPTTSARSAYAVCARAWRRAPAGLLDLLGVTRRMGAACLAPPVPGPGTMG